MQKGAKNKIKFKKWRLIFGEHPLRKATTRHWCLDPVKNFLLNTCLILDKMQLIHQLRPNARVVRFYVNSNSYTRELPKGAVHKLCHTNFKIFRPPAPCVSFCHIFIDPPPVLWRTTVTFIPYNFQVRIIIIWKLKIYLKI